MPLELVADRSAAPGTVDDGALRHIYESGIVGVAVWDNSGRISQANARFLEMVGYARHDLEAQRLDWQRLCGHAGAEVHCMPEQVAGVGNGVPIFRRYLRSDGTPVFLRVHSTSLGRGKTLTIVVDVARENDSAACRD